MNEDILSQLTPEQIDAWVKQGSIEPRMAMLDKQLSQANALRGLDTNNHTSGLGGALGAVAGMMNAHNAKGQMDQIRGKESDLLGQGDAASKGYIEALIRALRGGGGGEATTVPGADATSNVPFVGGDY